MLIFNYSTYTTVLIICNRYMNGSDMESICLTQYHMNTINIHKIIVYVVWGMTHINGWNNLFFKA